MMKTRIVCEKGVPEEYRIPKEILDASLKTILECIEINGMSTRVAIMVLSSIIATKVTMHLEDIKDAYQFCDDFRKTVELTWIANKGDDLC
jgi:hypothetical protein